jgi:hypothetical protein
MVPWLLRHLTEELAATESPYDFAAFVVTHRSRRPAWQKRIEALQGKNWSGPKPNRLIFLIFGCGDGI